MSIMRKNVFYPDPYHFNINMDLMTSHQESMLLQLLYVLWHGYLKNECM